MHHKQKYLCLLNQQYCNCGVGALLQVLKFGVGEVM